MRFLEIYEVYGVFVLFHGVTLLTVLVTRGVIVKSDLSIPGSRNENILVTSPIIETTDIILLSLSFLGLLEFLHFCTIFDVNRKETTFLITYE